MLTLFRLHTKRKKGFLYLKQFDVESLREFRDFWRISPRIALKKIERVRAFIRFALENGWFERNPAKLVRGATHIKDSQKPPFTPDETERIVEACSSVEMTICSNNELLAFTLLLRYGGLRIVDGVMLTLERFNGNDLYLYTQKSGTHVYLPLPPFLMNLIRGLKPRHGKYLFVGPESLQMDLASDLWRRRLADVFKLAKVESAQPHRFRHTFAVDYSRRACLWRKYRSCWATVACGSQRSTTLRGCRRGRKS